MLVQDLSRKQLNELKDSFFWQIFVAQVYDNHSPGTKPGLYLQERTQ